MNSFVETWGCLLTKSKFADVHRDRTVACWGGGCLMRHSLGICRQVFLPAPDHPKRGSGRGGPISRPLLDPPTKNVSNMGQVRLTTVGVEENKFDLSKG